jgi:hypothetical protein
MGSRRVRKPGRGRNGEVSADDIDHLDAELNAIEQLHPQSLPA